MNTNFIYILYSQITLSNSQINIYSGKHPNRPGLKWACDCLHESYNRPFADTHWYLPVRNFLIQKPNFPVMPSVLNL